MIYLDYNATTPCDERVVQAMLPWLTERFANPHSDSHSLGREAGEALHDAIGLIANRIGCHPESLVMTSGATESINLAMRGVMTHPRNRRRRMVVVRTEHPAVIDVAEDLRRDDVDVVWIDTDRNGTLDLPQLRNAVDDQTALVNVMIANNEIGTIAPIAEVAEITHAAGALLHCDATQAIGRLPIDAAEMDIDLLSASAHKFYGPKAIGFLVAGNGNRRVRLRPQIIGGGQQRGLRSGTMNPAGVIAMAKAVEIANEDRDVEMARIASLGNRLWSRLTDSIDGLRLNGPDLNSPVSKSTRLPGNLNFRSPGIEGQTWMMATPGVAFSSGSACSSVEAAPSHVLTAIGLSESEARRSVRFGIGRFTTQSEIDQAADQLIASYTHLMK